MNTFGLSIVASDKVFFRGRGINIVIPAQDGQVSILAHHADMMITVVPGEMRFQTEDEQWHEAIVGNGFAQIINNRVSLFADSIEKPEDIDEKRAKEALERAEEQLRQKQSMQEYYVSKASLARAMARMKASKRHEKGKCGEKKMFSPPFFYNKI